MNQGFKHKCFATLLLLVVLFPFALQASHALESHEHVICTAKDVKHFHNQEFDCSIFHTPVENQSDGLDFDYKVLTNKKYTPHYRNQAQVISFGYLSLKSTRAPPCFIV